MLNCLPARKRPLDASKGHAILAMAAVVMNPRPAATGWRRCPPRALAAGIVLLAGMVFSSGVAAAPPGPSIRLDVRYGSSGGSEGYTDTTASNGATYSYKYSGGGGKGGDVVFDHRGRVTISVHLSGNTYSIEDVGFTGDIHKQLSRLPSPAAARVAVIQNRNDMVQTANYKITVVDEDGVKVPCDPKIINR